MVIPHNKVWFLEIQSKNTQTQSTTIYSCYYLIHSHKFYVKYRDFKGLKRNLYKFHSLVKMVEANSFIPDKIKPLENQGLKLVPTERLELPTH